MWQYLLPRYQRLLNRFANHALCFIHDASDSWTSKSLVEVALSPFPAQPSLQVSRTDDHISLVLHWQVGPRKISFEDTTALNAALVMENHTLHAISSNQSLRIVQEFLPGGKMSVSENDWPVFLEEKLMEWRMVLPVQFDPEFITESSTTRTGFRIYLSERDDVLIIQPAFLYGSREIRWGYEGDITLPQHGKVTIVQRQYEVEAAFLQQIQNLHSDMRQSAHDHFFLSVLRRRPCRILVFSIYG